LLPATARRAAILPPAAATIMVRTTRARAASGTAARSITRSPADTSTVALVAAAEKFCSTTVRSTLPGSSARRRADSESSPTFPPGAPTGTHRTSIPDGAGASCTPSPITTTTGCGRPRSTAAAKLSARVRSADSGASPTRSTAASSVRRSTSKPVSAVTSRAYPATMTRSCPPSAAINRCACRRASVIRSAAPRAAAIDAERSMRITQLRAAGAVAAGRGSARASTSIESSNSCNASESHRRSRRPSRSTRRLPASGTHSATNATRTRRSRSRSR
jgi:hypothetical protein